MTTRETLHHLVDELPDTQAKVARIWLEDLRDAAACESLDRGLADVAAGRVKTLAHYERERNS